MDVSVPRTSMRRATVAVPVFVVALGLLAAACGGGDVSLPPEAREGRLIANSSGCAGCHGTDGGGGVGPTWVDLFGSQVEFVDGSTATADEQYLYRAITDPQAQVVAGYNVSMPANNLSDEQIAKVIAYIRELSRLAPQADAS
jgi:cytochrome c oxidase subunit 2